MSFSLVYIFIEKTYFYDILAEETCGVLRGMNIVDADSSGQHYRAGAKDYPNIRNWLSCSQLCQSNSSCAGWIWHHENSGSYAFHCVTVTSFSRMIRDDNCVSGFKSHSTEIWTIN